jgi:hypothetical protein
MDTFALHPLWGQEATPVRSSQPAPDLPAVAAQFEEAIGHLRSGQLTAGTALADAALARFRYLLGEVDTAQYRPLTVNTWSELQPLAVTAPDLKARINGLVSRRVSLLIAVDNADTGDVLSRMVFRPWPQNGTAVDVDL